MLFQNYIEIKNDEIDLLTDLGKNALLLYICSYPVAFLDLDLKLHVVCNEILKTGRNSVIIVDNLISQQFSRKIINPKPKGCMKSSKEEVQAHLKNVHSKKIKIKK